MSSLTRSEFAAVRAYVQGMPASMVVSRYLDLDDDDDPGESALRMLLGLRDRMVQLAHLHGRAELAELLELGPGRSNRGMDRRVEALGELERLGMALPRPAHGVELWFAPALARRLRAVGVDNLAALAGLVNRKGKGWWRSVPRIGVLAATAINRWLDQQRGALKGDDGVALVGRDMDTVRSHVPVSYAPGMARVVPFEWMAVSSEDERFAAGLVAVQAWLAGFPAFEATWLAYRRETERLLLWAVIVLQKPLFELNKHDCATYLLFLRRPIPEADWIGPRTSRAGMDWRPFQGPLGDAGVAQAVRVLASLHAHLVRVGHVRENHWRSERVLPSERPSGDEALGRHQIAAVDIAPFVAWLNRKSPGADEVRLRAAAAAIHLIRATGWRAAALVSATADHVLSEQGYAAGDEVTAALERFPEAVMVALSRHWADRGLTWDAASHPGAPLLAPPVMPNTGRARRKQDRGGATGYSVRGLHMLVSAAVARYRAEENPGFPLLAPGAFRLADVRTAR